ncbi:MAG: glycoside hydrolase family 16 protein [Polyangiaceae bacterium]
MPHSPSATLRLCTSTVATVLLGCSGNGSLLREDAELVPAGAADATSPPIPDPATPGASLDTSDSAAPGGVAPVGTSPAAVPVPAEPPPAGTETGPFRLAWQDDFDTLDSSRWQLMTHSWDGNLAQFSTYNARVADGILKLELTAAAGDTVKPFRGVELRSLQALTYGKVEARVRFARGSGVVSAMVLIYTPWPADDWNELDIELLGRYSDRVQFNSMVYTGPPQTPPVSQSVTPTQYPQLVTLPFDPTAEFHVFAIEWTPEGARFVVDGVQSHAWATEIDRMKLPQNILLTIWASSSPEWAGPIAPDTAPVTADYDWVRVYEYVQ